MKKLLFILLFAAIITIEAMAQIISFDAGFDENQIKMRVKQLDEFISRFNYESDIHGNQIEDKQDQVIRKKYVYSLFNSELFDNMTDTLPELYDEFVSIVTDDFQPAYINFTDSNWMAQAECKAIFNGEQIDITVFLQIEHIKGYEYKWVIIGVKDSIFSLNPKRQNPGLIISPTDNELRFMSLPDLSSVNQQDITNYSSKDYLVDKLTVFNTLVYTGQLNIKYIEKVNYVFFQIPGYVFEVKHFVRSSYNSGWLISKIEKKEDYKKASFWNDILNK